MIQYLVLGHHTRTGSMMCTAVFRRCTAAANLKMYLVDSVFPAPLSPGQEGERRERGEEREGRKERGGKRGRGEREREGERGEEGEEKRRGNQTL